jgi:hypothetical protein
MYAWFLYFPEPPIVQWVSILYAIAKFVALCDTLWFKIDKKHVAHEALFPAVRKQSIG